MHLVGVGTIDSRFKLSKNSKNMANYSYKTQQKWYRLHPGQVINHRT